MGWRGRLQLFLVTSGLLGSGAAAIGTLWRRSALQTFWEVESRRPAGLSWRELPELPEPHGLAGAFAGASGSALLVAGGSNFPAGRPWEGAVKTWHRDVFVLERPDADWLRLADALPCELAYGVSVSHGGALLVVGGGNATMHSDQVWELAYTGSGLRLSELARLPSPLAFSQGALVGEKVYVAGGLASPKAARPTKALWRLDLARPAAQWEVLEPPPGPSRMLAAAGAYGDAFYLVGGTDLDPNGPGGRVPLRSAWRYQEASGWTRLQDLPHATVAAPSPMPVIGASGFLLLLGGDDGRYYGTALSQSDQHPGFLNEVLGYDVAAGNWSILGRLPKRRGPDPGKHPEQGIWPPVTTATALWAGGVAVPCGEVRPGVRTRRVLWAQLPS